MIDGIRGRVLLAGFRGAPGGDREARDALFAALARATGSALVHRIGNVAVLYRPRAESPRILIPDR